MQSKTRGYWGCGWSYIQDSQVGLRNNDNPLHRHVDSAGSTYVSLFTHYSILLTSISILYYKSSSRSVNMKLLSTALAVSLLTTSVTAGPAAYGVCQAGCAAVVMACYGAAGSTWGATLGATAPASIIACNMAFGKCQAACAAVLLAPTP